MGLSKEGDKNDKRVIFDELVINERKKKATTYRRDLEQSGLERREARQGGGEQRRRSPAVS